MFKLLCGDAEQYIQNTTMKNTSPYKKVKNMFLVELFRLCTSMSCFVDIAWKHTTIFAEPIVHFLKDAGFLCA